MPGVQLFPVKKEARTNTNLMRLAQNDLSEVCTTPSQQTLLPQQLSGRGHQATSNLPSYCVFSKSFDQYGLWENYKHIAMYPLVHFFTDIYNFPSQI